MVLYVGFEFRDRGSNPNECQSSRDVNREKVNFTIVLAASS